MTDTAMTILKPFLLAAIADLKQLNADVGTDPTTMALKFPGALAAAVGKLELQVLQLVPTAVGALQNAVDARLTQLETQVQNA